MNPFVVETILSALVIVGSLMIAYYAYQMIGRYYE